MTRKSNRLLIPPDLMVIVSHLYPHHNTCKYVRKSTLINNHSVFLISEIFNPGIAAKRLVLYHKYMIYMYFINFLIRHNGEATMRCIICRSRHECGVALRCRERPCGLIAPCLTPGSAYAPPLHALQDKQLSFLTNQQISSAGN
ncbi:hypothetical protein SAMN05421755_10346 [Nitrosomonas sp. Nm33]|nr:hypothetical protein SAMN05421755_10346 [Nitrosomonas sp. Nm33]